MSHTLLVLPTYNEAENIRPMVKRLLNLETVIDVLVVDDNSPDGTGDIASELSELNECVHVLHRQEKDGLGRAYCAGFAWALERDYDFVFEMDCDFSHSPTYINNGISTISTFYVIPKCDIILYCTVHFHEVYEKKIKNKHTTQTN